MVLVQVYSLGFQKSVNQDYDIKKLTYCVIGGDVVIAQEGYWKRVEISDIDSVSLKMKAGLYKCPPGVCLGSVKYAICCKSHSHA